MPMAKPPPRRRARPVRRRPPPPRSRTGPKTRLQLLTYAFSKLPPRQLPFLAIYAFLILRASEAEWVDKDAVGKAGAAVVGVLSMVTGLLLSYRFSSAVSKWDEGKQVWVEVRSVIRDGIRMLSIPIPTQIPTSTPPVNTSRSASTNSSTSSPIDLGADEAVDTTQLTRSERGQGVEKQEQEANERVHGQSGQEQEKSARLSLAEKNDELSGLLVGFAFTLQHHLQGSRPLPQPPLCDLLPPAYLLSLKRTEARVRFAESHAGPSGSTTPSLGDLLPRNAASTSSTMGNADSRPGLRRRSTGPPTEAEKAGAAEGEDEWELSNLRDKAEEAVAKLAEAVATAGLSDGADLELRQQLSQLNLPDPDKSDVEDLLDGTAPIGPSSPTPIHAAGAGGGGGAGAGVNLAGGVASGGGTKPKSNLYSPYPLNLPLALLKLMEAYVMGLAEQPEEKGGWSDSKRERGLGIVKTLSGALGEAERLSSNPPPLPLTLHLSHLLIIYLAALPCSLLCVVQGRALILITLVAGWCLLGLEALIGEVGGVFGNSENHHPLPRFTQQILLESLDISPPFLKYYKARLVARLGNEDESVVQLDKRNKRGEEWLPFSS